MDASTKITIFGDFFPLLLDSIISWTKEGVFFQQYESLLLLIHACLLSGIRYRMLLLNSCWNSLQAKPCYTVGTIDIQLGMLDDNVETGIKYRYMLNSSTNRNYATARRRVLMKKYFRLAQAAIHSFNHSFLHSFI